MLAKVVHNCVRFGGLQEYYQVCALVSCEKREAFQSDRVADTGQQVSCADGLALKSCCRTCEGALLDAVGRPHGCSSGSSTRRW